MAAVTSQLAAVPIEKSIALNFQNNPETGLNILKLIPGGTLIGTYVNTGK